MTVTTFQIHSRGSDNFWDVRTLVSNVKWTTDADFAAGELTFDVMEVQEGFTPADGDEVRFAWNGQNIFYGYIFTVNYKSEEVFSCTAYDHTRYLKNEDSLVWPASTLAQRFNTACDTAGIAHRVVYDSQYKLPAKVSDGVTYFSMLQDDVESTKSGFGQGSFIRDNFGTVELCAMPLPTSGQVPVVGDGSINTSWEYDRSIDSAYNVVKVVKSSQKNAGNSTATASDDPDNTVITSQSASGSTVGKWGKLQKVEKVSDDKMNDAQMLAKAKELLGQYNKETTSMKVSAIGDLYFQVGAVFVMKINSLGDIGIVAPVVTINKCTHNFDDKQWTVDLEVSF